MHCEVNDFRDVAESKTYYRIGTPVVDCNAYGDWIMKSRARKADIRHVTSAFVDGLRM